MCPYGMLSLVKSSCAASLSVSDMHLLPWQTLENETLIQIINTLHESLI